MVRRTLHQLLWLLIFSGLRAAPQDSLFERGTPRLYENERLTGIMLPVGGIGTGHVGIDGSARRTHWFLTGEHLNVAEIDVPNSFFGVRVKTETGAPVLRALQTVDETDFKALTRATLRMEYPFGWFDFQDTALPVHLSLEVLNPFIPGDSRNSAIPCAVYTFTAQNTSRAPVEVSFLATQRNLLGTRIADGFGGNTNRIIRDKKAVLLHLKGNASGQGRYDGDMVLLALDSGAAACADWETVPALAAQFAPQGRLAGPDSGGPTADGITLNGALAVPFVLQPGESRSVTFVLTWSFPSRISQWGTGDKTGAMYLNFWQNALETARYLESALPSLIAKTRLFHNALYASNLPCWFLEGISSQMATLRSPVCFWNKDGYVGLYEGWRAPGTGTMNNYQDGNCIHVIQYGQLYAALFPDIARKLRECDFQRQSPDGGLATRVQGNDVQYGALCPLDGMCGEILGVYREHLSASDNAFLSALWPKTKKAMQYAVTTWDADTDGVLSGLQPNTYDGEMAGNNTFLGSLYLAALAASEKMALLQNDPLFATQCADIRQSGSRKQDSALFNGDFYIQSDSGSEGYFSTCFSDQLLGVWWANQLGLDPLYPADHVASAAKSIFQKNYHSNFADWTFIGNPYTRRFAEDADAGLVNSSGGSIKYRFETWTGVEYAASALLMQTGSLEEGFTVFKSARARYSGALRSGWEFGNGGNPLQDVEWGNYYFRAQSNGSILKACQGILFNRPQGILHCKPVWKPDNHRSVFMAGAAWGLFSQEQEGGRQQDTLLVLSDTLSLRHWRIALNGPADSAAAFVKLNNVPVQTSLVPDGNDLTIVLPQTLSLDSGSVLTAEIQNFLPNRNEELESALPFSLASFPNPFNPAIALRINMAASDGPQVFQLDIYSIAGDKIWSHQGILPDKVNAATVSWNGRDNRNRNAGSGIYLVRARTRGRTACLTVIKVK